MLTPIPRKALLVCGVAAALVIIAINLLPAVLWPGYDFLTQSISELRAVGAPTQALALPLDILYGVLITAFSICLWFLGRGNWALRLTAVLLLGYALLGLADAIFFPMRVGASVTLRNNNLYSTPMAVSVLCIVLAMGAGALALRNWFRFYSLGTLVTFAVLTLLSIFVFPELAAEPAVRVGLQERSMMFFNLLWLLLLALALRREPAPR